MVFGLIQVYPNFSLNSTAVFGGENVKVYPNTIAIDNTGNVLVTYARKTPSS